MIQLIQTVFEMNFGKFVVKRIQCSNGLPILSLASQTSQK